MIVGNVQQVDALLSCGRLQLGSQPLAAEERPVSRETRTRADTYSTPLHSIPLSPRVLQLCSAARVCRQRDAPISPAPHLVRATPRDEGQSRGSAPWQMRTAGGRAGGGGCGTSCGLVQSAPLMSSPRKARWSSSLPASPHLSPHLSRRRLAAHAGGGRSRRGAECAGDARSARARARGALWARASADRLRLRVAAAAEPLCQAGGPRPHSS